MKKFLQGKSIDDDIQDSNGNRAGSPAPEFSVLDADVSDFNSRADENVKISYSVGSENA